MKRTLLTVGLGAGLMYLLDPQQGEARRAQLRDKFQGLMPRTSGAVSDKVESIGMKAIDLTSQMDEKAAETITTAIPPQVDGANGDSSNANGSKPDDGMSGS